MATLNHIFSLKIHSRYTLWIEKEPLYFCS